MTDFKDDKEEEDFALFRKEVRDASPIKPTAIRHQTLQPKPRVRKQTPTESYQGETFSDMFAPETVGNEEYLEYRGLGIQHKQFSKLKSGKIHLEAELDLHGHTLIKAEPLLVAFLEHCQKAQIRYVRIIHGKGWGSRDNKPVLKAKLNHWLRQSDKVLAFCSATIEDGGSGALYVLLKRIND